MNKDTGHDERGRGYLLNDHNYIIVMGDLAEKIFSCRCLCY